MNYLIRKQTKTDISGVQKVVTKSWNDTYPGIIDDDFLESLKINELERIENAEKTWKETDDKTYVAEVNNKIIGFVKYDEFDKEKLKYTGEITSLYLLKEYHKNGIGKDLFKTATKELINLGYKQMVVGCLQGNKTNNFYIHLGGKLIGTRVFTRNDNKVIENLYLYENLEKII